MRKYAIIVAGGEGTRLGGSLPKQFREVCGRPLLWWSMKAFRDEDPSVTIILVVNSRFVSFWSGLSEAMDAEDRIAYVVVCGGASRTESVKNGLAEVPDGDDVYVAVHDAARPLVSPAMIARGWEAALASGGAVPVVPVTDSLRRLSDGGSEAVDRSGYVAVQTPQVFRASLLKDAYMRYPGAVYSDDASAVEAAGMKVALFEGATDNMKVTNSGDIEVASLLMERRNLD